MNERQRAAERLGVRFNRCASCGHMYAWNDDETFSVTTKSSGGDYDDGDSKIEFCCSHLCASRLCARLSEGIIWRNGKCGGTLMPSLEEP